MGLSLTQLVQLLGLNDELEEAPAPPDPFAEIRKANEGVRSAAKWMLTSLGAVGALMLGGVQFSSLGKLTDETPHERIVAAVVGLGLGAVGILAAIWFTSIVIAPFNNTLRSTNKHQRTARRVLDDGELIDCTYDQFLDGYRKAKDAYHDADDATLPEAEALWNDWLARRAAAFNAIGSQLLTERFGRARIAITVGALAATIGLGLFAWGSNPPDPKPGPEAAAVALAQAPVLVNVHLTPVGTEGLKQARGCSNANSRALIVGAKRELVTIPTATCKSVRFILTTDLGLATAAG